MWDKLGQIGITWDIMWGEMARFGASMGKHWYVSGRVRPHHR
jgi:hypothetical protein